MEFEASMPSIEKIVIAGAGQAGGRAAEALRSAGFRGSITMIGEEKHPPYERPQLSKELLAALDAPVAYLKPASDWTGVLDARSSATTGSFSRPAPSRSVLKRSRERVRKFTIFVTSKTRCICASRSIAKSASSSLVAVSSALRRLALRRSMDAT